MKLLQILGMGTFMQQASQVFFSYLVKTLLIFIANILNRLLGFAIEQLSQPFC
jgi:hypothetical protein